MNKIIWKDNEDIVAGTTLRDVQVKEDNNMALHVGGNLTDVIANRQGLSEDLDISLINGYLHSRPIVIICMK